MHTVEAVTEASERWAFETEVIGRAMRHDLVLHGRPNGDHHWVFDWRSVDGIVGPEFDNRALAVNWMTDWLAYDTAYGDC
jgi:hypothetical protein